MFTRYLQLQIDAKNEELYLLRKEVIRLAAENQRLRDEILKAEISGLASILIARATD